MKIAVAMSGGVDSSVAALLLRQEGHDVEGVTMALGAPGAGAGAVERQAAAAARTIGVPHRVIDVSLAFERLVVGYFVSEYARGRTPNPCVSCNRLLKFGILLDDARARGAALATGHYARVARAAQSGALRLLRGRDRAKDQSYFLYSLTQAELRVSVFPLGTLTKEEVRRIAADAGLAPVVRDESADACFVPGGDVAAFLRARAPGAAKPGPIVDASGARIGTHRGYGLYTIGQRSALGLPGPGPSYVVRIEPSTNTIVAGPDHDLYADSLEAADLSWIAGAPSGASFRARGRVRSAAPLADCVVTIGRGTARVRFDAPQRAIAPGQAVVLYDGDAVLGGGTIASVGPGA